MSVKQALKGWLQRHPRVWGGYWRLKQELLRVALLRYFIYDIGNVYRWMFWLPDGIEKRTLAAAMIFQYHKLEKGMCMPGPKRLFGVDPARAVMALVQRWDQAGHPKAEAVYLGAIATLRAFAAHLRRHNLDSDARILPAVEHFLLGRDSEATALSTPIPLPDLNAEGPGNPFSKLALARRSVRDFAEREVPRTMIEEAVRVAQLSPSACNRQPCRVYLMSDSAQKEQVLSYQNGNRGFGHLAPIVLAITADESCFFDASERNQPYIDGGLFSMSLCYALTSAGLASCCLNWCVPVHNDLAVHKILGIPGSERIIMLMAVGYPAGGCRVPLSPRRDIADVLRV